MLDKDILNDEVFIRMKKVITNLLEINEEKIIPDARFREDLGADSLDGYEFVYRTEEEFGISIPNKKAREISTVREAYYLLKAQIKNQH